MTDSDWLTEISSLLLLIQRQDAIALRRLYDITNPKILGLINRIVNNTHEAEDVLQEVFIKVWQQSAKYNGSGSAWGWICVLARNCAIDRLRSIQAKGHVSTDESPELLNQLFEDNDVINHHWLGECLKELKPKTSNAILLSYVNGYSNSELAIKLALPLGTVKAIIRRGLQELKKCLVA